MCSSSCFPFIVVRLVIRHSTVRLLLLSFSFSPCCWPFLSTFLRTAFLRSLFTQSSYLSCDLPCFLQSTCFFVSDLFGDLSSFILIMCPAHLIRLFTILLALVPTFSLNVFCSPSLHSHYTGYSPYPVFSRTCRLRCCFSERVKIVTD